MKLSILYRGPLASCNYGCGYCPFAKRHDPSAALAADAAMLERFVAWCRDADDVDLSILFTPWGEALTRRWYRDAMVTLSHLPHVALVSAQTNLSQDVGWVAAADPEKLRLWCTFHPTETDRATFVRRSQDLHDRGIAHSAGIVGFPAHLAEARRLRADLDPTTYLWVNPAEGLGRPYTDDEVTAWAEVDPLFELALRDMASAGRPCRTGDEVISVDGAGDVRRCHFVDQVIANIYDPDWRTALAPRPCPNATCDCFIGYVHRDRDLYDEHFGATLLTRIPSLRRPG